MISITEINKNIHVALRTIKGNLTGKGIQEPDCTAALSVEFPKILSTSGNLPKNIKFGGCFIHQSPKAEFLFNGLKGTCELGDMMVFIHKKTKEGIRYNAALLQMKKSDYSPCILKEYNDLRQLSLYEQWPKFDIKNKRGPFHNPYDIYPKTANQGAMYCLIQNRANALPQFYMSEPLITMCIMPQYTFGRFIVNMIDWHAGRAVSEILDKNADEWSKLVWDIFLFTAQHVFNRKNVKYTDKQRLTIGFMQEMMGKADYFKEPTANFSKDISEKETDTGFGILFVDVDERERPLEQ